MIGLPNPYVILGAVLVAIALYFFGHHKGWAERDMEMQVEIARKNDEARQTEQKLNEQLNQTATKLSEANDVIGKKQTDLNNAIRAGRVRLSTASCLQTPASATPAPGNRDEKGSQPDRQADTNSDAATLEAIAAIIAQGDRNTEQLNACIDAYNTLRTQLNGQR